MKEGNVKVENKINKDIKDVGTKNIFRLLGELITGGLYEYIRYFLLDRLVLRGLTNESSHYSIA